VTGEVLRTQKKRSDPTVQNMIYIIYNLYTIHICYLRNSLANFLELIQNGKRILHYERRRKAESEALIDKRKKMHKGWFTYS
jgi:hypothetical protein